MQIYLVGGAVRDRLLGLPVRERDWVVVGATPAELEAQGYRRVGRSFPVYLHPVTHEEYALARTELKTGPGYHGFDVRSDPSVTLEEDLQRRDLTINAIAEDSFPAAGPMPALPDSTDGVPVDPLPSLPEGVTPPGPEEAASPNEEKPAAEPGPAPKPDAEPDPKPATEPKPEPAPKPEPEPDAAE